MDPYPPEFEAWKPAETATVSGVGTCGMRWGARGKIRRKNHKSLKNDPISALSHLAPGRSPAYIGTGCRWPRSCRSVRTSNGSNRGSARVAWCFHSISGCRPHVAWGVHRLVVPAVPPYLSQAFGTRVHSEQAYRPEFSAARLAAVRGSRTLATELRKTRTFIATPAHALGSLTPQTRFAPRPEPTQRNPKIPVQPRFQ